MTTSTPRIAPQLLDLEQAAERLGVTYHWLQRAARAGEVPSIALGRYPRFTEDHLIQIIEQAERRLVDRTRGTARTRL